MYGATCKTPIEYWLDELDEVTEARIDEHLFDCQECGTQPDEISALAAGVRTAFGQGAIRAVVTGAFVRRLAERQTRHEHSRQ